MPTSYRDESIPVVQFDPQLEVSPFAIFRRLREGRGPLLVDVRAKPQRFTLKGARHQPEEDWKPPRDEEVVLFDDDGSEALPRVQRLVAESHTNVKALFGGLQLWEFSLDPEVVGEETYLVPLADAGEAGE